MIKVNNLVKSYGKKQVLNNVSFHINKGEVVGFLGPNGAGKTTTMNIITGYISSDSGSVTIGGNDILEKPYEVKKCIGYLPELPPLYYDMTVTEYLNFVYELKGAKNSIDVSKEKHIQDVLEAIHISHVSGRLIKNLSKGYKQRVGIAQALIGNPEVLILDEPTVGLDPKQIIEIRNLIGELKEDHTIILSSHVLPEVSAICERVIIISNGNIVAEDTPENLALKFFGNRFVVSAVGCESDVEALFSSVPEVIKYSKKSEFGNTVTYNVTFSGDSVDSRIKLFNKFSNSDVSLIELKPVELSLEEIFVKLTDSAEKEGE